MTSTGTTPTGGGDPDPEGSSPASAETGPRQRRREVYGGALGAVAFAVGLAITYASFLRTSAGPIPRWQLSSWLYLGANSVPVVGAADAPGTANALARRARPSFLRIVPPVLVALATILAVRDDRNTHPFRATARTALSVALGYIVAGVGVMRISAARPSISEHLGIFLLVSATFAVGAVVLRPIFEAAPVMLMALIWSGVAAGIMALLLTSLLILQAATWMVALSVGVALSVATALWVMRHPSGPRRYLPLR